MDRIYIALIIIIVLILGYTIESRIIGKINNYNIAQEYEETTQEELEEGCSGCTDNKKTKFV